MSVDGAFGGIKSIGCVSQVGLRGVTRKIDSCMQDFGDTLRSYVYGHLQIFQSLLFRLMLSYCTIIEPLLKHATWGILPNRNAPDQDA